VLENFGSQDDSSVHRVPLAAVFGGGSHLRLFHLSHFSLSIAHFCRLPLPVIERASLTMARGHLEAALLIASRDALNRLPVVLSTRRTCRELTSRPSALGGSIRVTALQARRPVSIERSNCSEDSI